MATSLRLKFTNTLQLLYYAPRYSAHSAITRVRRWLPRGHFRYNAHLVIMLILLGSRHERYNEAAVYCNNFKIVSPKWTKFGRNHLFRTHNKKIISKFRILISKMTAGRHFENHKKLNNSETLCLIVTKF